MSVVKAIIGIAGASGSGKSFLCERFADCFAEALGPEVSLAILNEDSYYRRQDHLDLSKRAEVNYDHPDAIEAELLASQIMALKAGNRIAVPQYDFATHNRSNLTTELEPAAVLLIEGILIFHHKEILKQIDQKVFLDVPLDICLARRIRRDTIQRGRTIQSVLDQYMVTVRPMYYQYVEPSKNDADVVFQYPIDSADLNQKLLKFLQPRILNTI
ncbi:MAG: uridine kinase [Planctomycetota bacterium]